MKTTLSLLLAFLFYQSAAQITISRMNNLKLETQIGEVEKILGQKLEPKGSEDNWVKHTEVISNGVPLRLGFVSLWDDKADAEVLKLWEISTISDQIKTLSGISVGDTMEELWDTYKNKFDISVWSVWDEKTQEYSKDEKYFDLMEPEEISIVRFSLKNGIITEITILINEGC